MSLNRHWSLSTLLSVFIWALLSASALSQPAADTAPPTLMQPPNATPAMWRLSDADSEIYLFGTIHLLPANINWNTEYYKKAMAATDVTVTEADLESEEALARINTLVSNLALNPDGTTLSSTIGADKAARLNEIAVGFGLPADQLETYRPWYAVLVLQQLAHYAIGATAEGGVEAVIRKQAVAEGDRLSYLELGDDQINILAALDDAEILGDFEETVRFFKEFETEMQVVWEAWQAGDLASIEQSALSDLRRDSPKAFDALILNRNKNWVAQIDNMMAGAGGYFIAVGAGHLVGEDSVVDLLVERGYAVERVQ